MKKTLALILAMIMALGCLTACGGTKEETPAETPTSPAEPAGNVSESEGGYEEWVYTAHADDIDTADPYGGTSSMTQKITNMTFDTVTYVDADTGEIMPELAHSWKDVSGTNTSWEFYLEDGVVFQNGDKFTAEDVKFTWEYAGVSAGNVVKPISAMDYVASIEVVDELTVRFNLNSGMPDFPAYMETKIYSKNAFDTMDPVDAGIIGTGPYYFDEEETVSGTQFVISRYEDYWRGVENYPTKHICFKVLPDENTRMAALQSGAIDFVEYQPASHGVLASDSNLNLYNRSGAQSWYMGFNYASPTMSDLEIRKALCQAINKDDLVAIAFENGLGGSKNDNFCIPTGLGYAEIDPLKYDPDAAKAVLDGKGLNLTIVFYAGGAKMAEVIQANLAQVGVTVNLQQVDATNWGAFKSAREGYDLFVDYAGYQGALLYNFNRFFYTGGSSNMFGYYSAEYEKLQDNVLMAPDWESMLEEFAVLQQFVADDIPIFPLGVSSILYASQNDVENLKLAPSDGYQDFAEVRIPKRS